MDYSYIMINILTSEFFLIKVLLQFLQQKSLYKEQTAIVFMDLA